MAQTNHHAERIRPGTGLRSLRRGEATNPLESTSTVLTRSSFRAMLRAAVDRTGSGEQALLLVRASIRAFPGRDTDLQGRELPEELVARLSAVHELTKVAALGSTELMLAVPSLTSRADAERLLGELADALTEPLVINRLTHHLAPRIGAALLDDDNPTIELLQDATRLALDETGPNQPTMLFHPFQRVRANLQRDLADDLRAAVVEKRTEVALEPIVDLGSREIVGYEVLARWNRPGHGAVPASEFTDLACSLGIDPVLQAHLFERSVALLSELEGSSGRGHGTVTLWLPVRPRQLLHPQFAPMLASAALPPRVRVGLVMTPTPTATGKAMTALRELTDGGVRAAMGDFGLGNANLTTVRSHGFDSITLDPTLTTRVATSPAAATIVEALLTIATTLGLVATAQGIEDAGQQQALQTMGCTLGQGSFLAQPITHP